MQGNTQARPRVAFESSTVGMIRSDESKALQQLHRQRHRRLQQA